ncbi:MAG: TIGR04282 family arsenosugar biosynthesis glycosyltransferase [Marinobacter sp.]|nr:TIGR04282 family arsenosugar biosynthesis glycosyltransferase [Marinobacter sp.]
MPQTNPPSAVFLQFAKWPEAGKVKTRLMPELGPVGALEAHVRLTLNVLDNLCATGYPVEFWWDREVGEPTGEALPILEELEGAGLIQMVQQGRSLGERMETALSQSLQEYDRALVVGSDCPSVDPDYARQAVACLADHDVVLGPSDDGGYVLIGASRVVEGMLDDIAWGTPEVLNQTCQRLEKAGLSYFLLEPRWDVDEPDDWARFLAIG